MSTSTWGCEICRAELYAVKFERLATIAEAKTTFLKVMQCQECHQWYEWQINGRIYAREPGESRGMVARIADGY